MHLTLPTRVVGVVAGGICARASIVTSFLATLGRPNLPATKNRTDVPPSGTFKSRVSVNAPVVPLRNTTAPALAADTDLSRTLTRMGGKGRGGGGKGAGFVIRIRQGEGAQLTNAAFGLMLSLICNSTFIDASTVDLDVATLGRNTSEETDGAGSFPQAPLIGFMAT